MPIEIDPILAGRVCDVLLKICNENDWDPLPVCAIERLKYMTEKASCDMENSERYMYPHDRDVPGLALEVLEYWLGVRQGGKVPHYWKFDSDGDIDYMVEHHLPAGYKEMSVSERLKFLIDSYYESEERSKQCKVFRCCLCYSNTRGYGNNARPLKEGQCCDECNARVVLARIAAAYEN